MLLELVLIGLWCLVATPAVSLFAWRKFRGLDSILFWLCWLLAQLCAPWTLMWLSPDNSVASVYRVRSVMSAAEAREIVDASEAFALSQGGWSTARHAHYPTTDVATKSLELGDALAEKIRQRVYPVLSKEYGVSNLSLRDLFVVKYQGSSQRGLRRHRDGCQLSFGIALNPPPKSTGTYFASFRHLLRDVQVGELWTHPSGLLHKAKPVDERGNDLRYVLIGFVTVPGPFWRTWGASATTLREFDYDGQSFAEVVFAKDGRATRTVCTWTLAKRSLRKLLRELLLPSNSSGLGTFLVYAAFFLFATLAIVVSMCCYDVWCASYHYLSDKDEDEFFPVKPLSDDEARGRYAADDQATTTTTTGARRRSR